MTARKLQVGECQCAACRSACANKPGWFLPHQIAPLAKAMGMTVKQLFERHLQVDWWVDTPSVFGLSPRVKGQKGGTMFPSNPQGACHWFVNGKCKIHDLGKPAECQQLGHGKNGRVVYGKHGRTADAWRPAKHQRTVRDLLGREPEDATSSSLAGLVDLLDGVFRRYRS